MSKTPTEKKVNHKRQIVVATMVVALGAAVFLNWYIGSKGVKPTSSMPKTTTSSENLGDAEYVNATTAADEYFTDAKLDRQSARDSSLSDLKEIVDDKNATDEEKKSAVETFSKLSERADTESDIETVIKAKGVSECIVILSDTSCEVIVPDAELSDTVALQVKEIVMNKVDLSESKITVVGTQN